MENCSHLTFVYWIHKSTHTDIWKDGYIGVTKDIKRRWRDHKTDARYNRHTNSYLGHAIKKYGDSLVWEIIFLGNEDACYKHEELLRPEPSIGWNLRSGGPVGKITEEGKKRISEASKKPWSKAKKLDANWHRFNVHNNENLTRNEFIAMTAIANKQPPNNKENACVQHVYSTEVFNNMVDAANAYECTTFEIYKACEEKDGAWTYFP